MPITLLLAYQCKVYCSCVVVLSRNGSFCEILQMTEFLHKLFLFIVLFAYVSLIVRSFCCSKDNPFLTLRPLCLTVKSNKMRNDFAQHLLRNLFQASNKAKVKVKVCFKKMDNYLAHLLRNLFQANNKTKMKSC